MRSKLTTLGLVGLLVASVAWCQSLVDPDLTRSTWATGLVRPTQIDFLGPEDLLVVEYPAPAAFGG